MSGPFRPNGSKPVLAGFSLILAVLLVWLMLFWEPARLTEPSSETSHAALQLAAPPTGGDFTLQSSQGPVRLADLRGQVVLIYFGYTACPDICPTNLAFIANALGWLRPDELARARVLFISVDPERDDLRRLADYCAYFHPNIQGLTGTPGQLAEVAALYGAVYHRSESADSAMGYLVDHSAFTYVVGPDGRLRQTLGHAAPPEEILAAIREALAADATP